MTKPAKIVTFGGLFILGIIFGIYKVNLYVKDQNAKTEAANYQIEQTKNDIDNLEINLGFQNIHNQYDSLIKDNEISSLQADLNKKETPKISVTDIVAEWQDRVALAVCQTTFPNGTIYETNQGSATLMNLVGYGTSAITNKHVVTNSAGYLSNTCVIGEWGVGGRTVEKTTDYSPFNVGNDDWAYVYLNNYIAKNEKKSFDNIVSAGTNVCKASSVSLGDSVIILGYPTIGTTNGITATEGIISGIEQNYYVTSAKIDHGNSGGAAILVKNDCWLGIPTEVVAGQLESLGRILKANLVLNN